MAASCQTNVIFIVCNSMFVLILFIGCHAVMSLHNPPTTPQFLYATKNSYAMSFDSKELNESNIELEDRDQIPRFCKPVHINAVFRHGTRTPNKKTIKRSSELISRIRHLIDASLFPTIKTWENHFLLHQSKHLTQSGFDEIVNISKRITSKYEELFTTSNHLRFTSTNLQRTIESANAFLHGLSGKIEIPEDAVNVTNFPLRFYDSCDKFTKYVEENKTAMNHFLQFGKSPSIVSIADKINKKLRIPDAISAADVNTLYTLTGHEIAAFGDSAWAQLFDQEDLLLLEYKADLKVTVDMKQTVGLTLHERLPTQENYWRKGPGYTINYEQACPLLTEMFAEIDKVTEKVTEKEQSYDRGVFRFGHAETIMPLLSLLSLYRDSEPPTQHNFHSQQNRQFRASRISPFAANIGFILYECEADDSSNHRSADKTSASDSKWPTLIEKFMLVLKVNERTTRFPFCQHHLCAYSEIKQQLHRYVSTCDFKELCRVEKEKINVKDEL